MILTVKNGTAKRYTVNNVKRFENLKLTFIINVVVEFSLSNVNKIYKTRVLPGCFIN